MTTPELCLVMPIYNEEANIGGVIGEWAAALEQQPVAWRLLAINDGSKDGTLAALQHLQEKHGEKIAIIDKANSGHGTSCRAGYEKALEQGARWILQVDSDGQCDPVYFAEFWRSRENADCIFGLRVSRGDGYSRKLISLACRGLTWLASGTDLKDANVPYRLMRREALAAALPQIPADFDIHNVALSLVLKRARSWRWHYVPIHFRERQGGVNSINIPKILRMGWKMLGQLRKVRGSKAALPSVSP